MRRIVDLELAHFDRFALLHQPVSHIELLVSFSNSELKIPIGNLHLSLIQTLNPFLFKRRNASDLKVRLGDYDISRDDETEWPYQEVSVKRIIMHPKVSGVFNFTEI